MNKTLSLLFRLSLIESFSPWLLILFYTTGINLIWSVNIIFILMTLSLMKFLGFRFRITLFSGFFLAFIVLSFPKFLLFFDQGIGFDIKHAFSYFSGLLIPFLALSYSDKFNASSKLFVYRILESYARKFTIISFLAIFIYSILYFGGRVDYFGLGANLHYSYPFLLVSFKRSAPICFLFFVIISGKRASLLNFLAQTVVYFIGKLRSNPLLPIVFLSSLSLLLAYLLKSTDLLNRFNNLLSGELDFSDSHMLYVSFGGRFEELQGIYNYFINHPYQIFFGSPPGASYVWEITQGEYYLSAKNYSHVTIIGLVFRYGIIYAVCLYGIFSRMLIKYWKPKDPLYLVFVGIMTSSFFGANLIADPTSWLFIGLLISLRRGDELPVSSVRSHPSVSPPRILRRMAHYASTLAKHSDQLHA